MSSADTYKRQYTGEAANVGAMSGASSNGFDISLLDYEETGDFFELLRQQDFSLGVTREYEHFLLLLDGDENGAIQSPFPLPHPSGFFFDANTRELVVSSTRTPNILIWMSPFQATEAGRSIMPVDYSADEIENHTLFLPRQARYLPGSLYIHDVVRMGGEIYATVTGHNFLARLSLEQGWERVWWPKVVDDAAPNQFNTNYLQLNSIAANASPEKSFYTGFSNLASGAKPWKEGYGPRGKGVVFSGETRSPILTGLTCPHAAKLADGKLWLCNSGFGTFGYVEAFETHDPDRTRYVPVGTAPGFTRGMAFGGDYVFVGVSKIIAAYEPYAPGLVAEESKCGVCVFNRHTGEQVASLIWPNGYQIYDVQILPGVKRPRLPLASREADGINPFLRFLG